MKETVRNTSISFENSVCKDIWMTTYGMPFYIQFFGDCLFKFKQKGRINNNYFKKYKKNIFFELGNKIFSGGAYSYLIIT